MATIRLETLIKHTKRSQTNKQKTQKTNNNKQINKKNQANKQDKTNIKKRLFSAHNTSGADFFKVNPFSNTQQTDNSLTKDDWP